MVIGALLFIPFSHAQASPVTAEKAYQKGDFATAEKEYALAAQHDPKKPDLEFNAGTAAYKAGHSRRQRRRFRNRSAANPPPTPSASPLRRTHITTLAIHCIAPAKRPKKASRNKPSKTGSRR
jgi:hypothetical protein